MHLNSWRRPKSFSVTIFFSNLILCTSRDIHRSNSFCIHYSCARYIYTCFLRNPRKSKAQQTYCWRFTRSKIYLCRKRSALNVRLFSRCLVTRRSLRKSVYTMKVDVFNPRNRVESISNYKLELVSLSPFPLLPSLSFTPFFFLFRNVFPAWNELLAPGLRVLETPKDGHNKSQNI